MRWVSSFWSKPSLALGTIGLAILASPILSNAVAHAAGLPDEKPKSDGHAIATKAAPIDFSAGVPKVPEAVRNLLQDRKYAEAVKAIDQASSEPGAARDYLLFLKGRALHWQQKYDDALLVFKKLEEQHPTSIWARRGKLARGVTLARQGDFRAAELIYRDEAVRLLSADRKQEIANLYLEFADAFFQPKESLLHAPDYAKALEFYNKVLEVGPKPDVRVEVELRVARCQQQLGKLPEAAALLAKLIKDRAGSPQEIEARFRLGEVYMALNQPEEARRTWQDLLAAHPDSGSERIAEAGFNLSLTFGLPTPASPEMLNLGVAALEAFLKKHHEHKLAPQAHLRIAQSYLHVGQPANAVKALTQFLDDKAYAQREEVADARNLLGLAYQQQKKFPEALAAWRDYLVKHPAHQAWSQVQQEIVNTEYLLCVEKTSLKQYDEARKAWNEFLAKYPLDARNPRIMFVFGQMNHAQKKWDEAIADWRRLVSKYPGSEEASRGQYMIAATLESELGKLDEALKEYKKVNWGGFAPRAATAVKRMTSKSLAIRTERAFRTNEKPAIKLTTRNVETVTVRAYKVDLETYFRKMHQLSGVEALDISLIDPDATFEFTVPKFVEYQQLESEIEVPLPDKLLKANAAGPAGVMAVTVSSKTLEATTLVVQSDLDIVIKSSRDEVFVFAQNMLTGKPWPQARLLLSNGQAVFAEGTTGDDGVFQKSFKELHDAGQLRVFAAAGNSTASNLVDLSGLKVADGLADKGYVYTDRPAYRAGQLVHVRGVLRKASDDAYVIEKGRKYTVEVFDGRNRVVWQNDVTLSEFGSFHAHFLLPPTSLAGAYRIAVRDDENHVFAGSFSVHEYQLESVKLAVETERKVFYRGEEIEGKIVAAFHYGAPLAGREIRYQLSGGPVKTATTDDKGEISFKLATRDFRETQVLPLVVTLPERNITTTQNFFLSSTAFSLNVSTLRPVFTAGETFEATVKAVDAEGKPVAQKVVLHVLEQTTVAGKVGEVEAGQFDVTTDAKNGIARHTLKLEKGARYVLRAEAIDRFNNPITGEHIVQVSDDSDRVRLRILAEKHTYRVGDTADVQLHWREEPALALVTFQGARILDYRLVMLQKGANKFSIPVAAKLAPNFNLEVTVMTDARAPKAASSKAPEKAAEPVTRFHLASSPFVVERDLRVDLTVHRKAGGPGRIRPGDEFELLVKTTDPQGKPVPAELSVAMIEQSLLSMFAWNVDPINDYFRGQPREPAVRTTSSVTFAYEPATRPIDRNLLAEAERLEIAADEAAHLSAGMLVVSGAATTRLAAIATPESAAALEGDRYGILMDSSGAMDDGVANGEVSQFAAAGRPMGGRGRGMSPQQLDSPVAGNDFFARGEVRLGDIAAYHDQRGPVDQLALGTNWAMARQSGSRAVNKPGLAVIDGKAVDHDADGAHVDEGKRLYNNWHAFATDDKKLGDVRFNNSAAVPTGQNFNGYWNEGRKDLCVMLTNGMQCNVSLAYVSNGRFDQEAANKAAQQLAAAGAVVLPQDSTQETGYWNPIVATDEKGEAVLSLTAPEQSTAWKFVARGTTRDTLTGEGQAELIAKKDLFAELRLPRAFTDGDDADIIVAVHNQLLDKGPITVILKTTIGNRVVEEKKTIEVKRMGIEETAFRVQIRRPAADATNSKDQVKEQPEAATDPAAESSITFELSVVVGETSDNTRRVVAVQPYGVPVYVAASGSANNDTTVWVEAPTDMQLDYQQLQILIGASVQRSLLDVVFGIAPECQLDAARFASGIDAASSDLMACLALQKLFAATRDAGGPKTQALDARVRTALSLLISSQQEDGGWTWTGHKAGSHPFTSARAVWAISMARKAGYKLADADFDRACNYLQTQIAATSETDFESKAVLLHALSAAGQGDFTLANRLYRNRTSLSNAALAYLVLAFVEMDRKPTAQELLTVLDQRNLDDPATRRRSTTGSLPWCYSPVEVRALHGLALEQLSPESPHAQTAMDWLMAHRMGHRWSPEKATGPATLALAQWSGRSKFADEHYKLTVFVNDYGAKVLDVTADTGSVVVEVPRKLLKTGKQRINFHLEGRGRYTFQAVLGGFVAADKLKNTTKDWQVRREHEPAPLEVDGQELPRGFGILQGSYDTFRNKLTKLPVGMRGQVELQISRNNLPSNTPDDQLEYLVVTEPLPSGVRVIESSIRGGFERYELGQGTITFYIGNRQHIEDIHFDVHGYLPGKYRAGPAIVRDAYKPASMAVSTSKELTVLTLGTKSDDAYRFTPVELYELGKRHFAKRDLAVAGRNLSQLLANWNVNPDTYKDVARMLLDIHVEQGPPAEVVRYFEIIKEKWPDLELSFEKIMKVGAAYHELGEYERSYLVFRATIASSFLRENGVAGFLESQGEFVRSVQVMNRLLAEYPPEPYVAEATFALAQRVYAAAPGAAADAKLREKKITRVDLVQQALAMLDHFLTDYPEDPASDQAAFSLANAMLELKAYRPVIAAATKFAERYQESKYLDSFWYIVAYGHFALGEHDQALEMARKVAEAKRLDKQTGREVESPNKLQAVYIMGQVFHSLGKAAEAIAEYTRVQDQFADAKQAIEYFTRRAAALPEVTTVKPGDPVEPELTFRNIATADVKVYRIDLMKFSLLKRNLVGITQINLSGIRPLVEQELKLGDGKDYRDRSQKLSLPLKEEGAYLVTCRGGDLYASGLVLISPLVVDVQEETASGRVRATVKNALKNSYVTDAHVKAIGSRNNEFVSGQTDLRGVFVGDGLAGTSTVIAQADGGRYAFFRGKLDLGPQPQPAAANGQPQEKKDGEKGKGAEEPKAEEQLLRELQKGNNDIQIRNRGILDNNYKQQPGGVQVQKAF